MYSNKTITLFILPTLRKSRLSRVVDVNTEHCARLVQHGVDKTCSLGIILIRMNITVVYVQDNLQAQIETRRKERDSKQIRI